MQDDHFNITIVDEEYIANAKAVYEEYADLINYFADLESGLVAPWTETEYNQTPEIIVQARRIFGGEWQKWKQDHQKQL